MLGFDWTRPSSKFLAIFRQVLLSAELTHLTNGREDDRPQSFLQKDTGNRSPDHVGYRGAVAGTTATAKIAKSIELEVPDEVCVTRTNIAFRAGKLVVISRSFGRRQNDACNRFSGGMPALIGGRQRVTKFIFYRQLRPCV